MFRETLFLVTAETPDALEKISAVIEPSDAPDGCSYEAVEVSIFDLMEKVILLTHQMNEADQKDNFHIEGKSVSDYDAIAFSIEYSGEEPIIKARAGIMDENEEAFFMISEAEYEEVPKLLCRNKKRTFKQAIKDQINLGGFLSLPYDEWVASIIE